MLLPLLFSLLFSLSLWSTVPAFSGGAPGAPPDSTQEQAATPDSLGRTDAVPASPDDDRPPVFGVLIHPLTLYSATYGFGLQVSASVYHVPTPGSRIRLSVWPSVRRQLALLEFEAPDPDVSRLFVHGRVLFSRNRAYRFYGVGPFSRESDRIELDRDAVDAELGLGLQRADRRALVIPYVRYAGQRVSTDPADLSDIPEQVGVTGATVDPARPTPGRGVAVGVQGELDGRDDPTDPSLGAIAQVRLERYTSLADQGRPLTYDVLDGLVVGYLPLVLGHRLVGRARLTLTRNLGDRPIPFYHFPVLDWQTFPGYERNRFTGPDLLLLQAEYQAPLFALGKFADLEGVVMVGAGNVYDDIGDQFRAAVEFGRDVARPEGKAALRPSLGVGFKVGSYLHWIVGFSPEDVTPFGPLRFQFTLPLRSTAPVLR